MTQNSNAKQAENITVYVDGDFRDIIPEILENTYQGIRTVPDALERGDYETIAMLGHSMSGVCLGFDAINEIGLSLEQTAMARNSEEIRKLMDELLTYLDRVEVVYG